MVTPKKNPFLLDDWKTLERQYINNGLSRRKSHIKIAHKYKVSADTVYYWLTPSWRKHHIQRLAKQRSRPSIKKKYRKYLRKLYEQPRVLEKMKQKQKERRHQGIKYEILVQGSIYIFRDVFKDKDKLTLEEICNKIHKIEKSGRYRKWFKEIYSVLPIKEVTQGFYKLKRSKMGQFRLVPRSF